MRWLPFLTLCYLAVGLQAGVGAWLGVGRARPDLVAVVVTWAAVTAPAEAALLGAVAAGAMLDFVSAGPFGSAALGYGLAGLAAVGLGREVSRSHPLTHAGLGAAVALVAWAVAASVDRARGGAGGAGAVAAIGSVVYTAGLTVVGVWALRRVRGLFVRRPYRD